MKLACYMKLVQLNQLKVAAKEEKKISNVLPLINVELVIHFHKKEEDVFLF